MSFLQLAWKGIRYYRTTGLLILVGIIIAATTLTGSLVVGDSVRGSLRDSVLKRLGNIDVAIVSTNLAPAKLIEHLDASPEFHRSFPNVVPILQAVGNAVNLNTNQILPHINLMGVKKDFPRAFPSFHAPIPHERDIVVNATVERALNLHIGDPLMLHIPSMAAVPTDSLFGRRSKEDSTRDLRVVVSAILPPNAGDFSLTASTGTPENIFISRDWLYRLLGKNTDSANLFLLVKSPSTSDNSSDTSVVKEALRRYARLSDFGLDVKANKANRYLNLQSDSIVMDNKVVQAAQQTAKDCGAFSTLSSIYLATKVTDRVNARKFLTQKDRNSPIAQPQTRADQLRKRHEKELHYLVVAGVGNGIGIDCPPNTILLNSWAFKRLSPKPHGVLRVKYLIPNWMGTYSPRSVPLQFGGLTDPAGEGYDEGLTPNVPGITDEESIVNWNPPFPINLGAVTQDDETYWKTYKAAPKAFANLDTLKSMWLKGSMDGVKEWITGVLILPRPIVGIAPRSPFSAVEMENLRAKFVPALLKRLVQNNAGLSVLPVRQLALNAASGSTDFGGLFIGLGFFLVIASLIFSGILMRLAGERRTSEAGALLALGFSSTEAVRAIKIEGVLLSLFGAITGTITGIAYAAFIIHLLTTKWRGAIGDTHLSLHILPSSLCLGFLLSFIVAVCSILFSLRKLSRKPVLHLIKGETQEIIPVKSVTRLEKGVQSVILIAVLLLFLSSTVFKLVSGAESFFAIGALLLIAFLNGMRIYLKNQHDKPITGTNLRGLALRNLSAGLLPSMMAIGLIAGGVFVLVSVAANVREFHQTKLPAKSSGSGGYSLIVNTTLPVNSGLTLLGEGTTAAPQDNRTLRQCRIMPFLASPGDDISCLNLAMPVHPRLLGVSREFRDSGGFDISTASNTDNAWSLLDADPENDAIPAFGDADSVEWTLHSGLGQLYTVSLPDGVKQRIRFVGLLEHSIFAGEILISSENFRKLFPYISYPRYFLVQTPPHMQNAATDSLQRVLGDYGVRIQTTTDFLNAVITVQNTYISAFLAMGGIGLLLGAAGLIASLLLNAWRRRKEFAMMIAIGFSRKDIVTLLLLEYGGILIIGLTLGTITALIASYPEVVSSDAKINWQILSVTLLAFLMAGILPCLLAGKKIASQDLPVSLKEE